MVSVLNKIGLRAHVKLIPLRHGIGDYFGAIFKSHPQIGYSNWIADYPSDGGFLPPLLSCRGLNGYNFCDHAVDHLFKVAERAEAQNPYAAPALWRRAERAVLAQAPIVPVDNPENIAFLAKRVGNFQYHPEWGVLLDQLWLK